MIPAMLSGNGAYPDLFKPGGWLLARYCAFSSRAATFARLIRRPGVAAATRPE
jgi:hypothetical protein